MLTLSALFHDKNYHPKNFAAVNGGSNSARNHVSKTLDPLPTADVQQYLTSGDIWLLSEWPCTASPTRWQPWAAEIYGHICMSVIDIKLHITSPSSGFTFITIDLSLTSYCREDSGDTDRCRTEWRLHLHHQGHNTSTNKLDCIRKLSSLSLLTQLTYFITSNFPIFVILSLVRLDRLHWWYMYCSI